MAVKDLTAFLVPDLELVWGGRTFRVPPPTKDVGLKLAAANAAGISAYFALLDTCPTCGRAGVPDGLPEETQALLESIKEVDLAELSLGPAYAEMIEAGVPGPHVDQFGVYALYYWVVGEKTADDIMTTTHGGDASGEAKAASTSKPGHHTGSGSRTRTASTRGTGASRKS